MSKRSKAGSAAPTLPTRVGHAGWSEQQFRGWRLFTDLHEATWLELNVLALTGRRPEPWVQRVLDAVAVSAAVADPRIWPLKIVRLISAYGSAFFGMAAAYAWQAHANVGASVARPVADLLEEWSTRLAGLDDDELVGRLRAEGAKGRLPGFGVPFREVDERLEALLSRLDDLDFDGAHVALVRRICRLAPKAELRPNFVLGATAVFLDLGVPVEGVAMLGMMMLNAAYLANAVEGARQAPEALQRLPDACVEYVGPPPRKSPRARAKEDDG